MDYNNIINKKPIYKIKAPLIEHLKQYSRLEKLPITYKDLLHYQDLIPLEDSKGEKTLWYSALYTSGEINDLHVALVEIYQMLLSGGEQIPHLKIDRIDFCSFGNSQPFRIRVINEINDNYDYFYVKRADSSRIYGLELEEIFSPDKVNYLVDKETLIEEHIVGIPMDEFIQKNKNIKVDNRLRLVKEFVKFNELQFPLNKLICP